MTRRSRDIAAQLIIVMLIAALLAFLAINLHTNLERMGIGSGLGFLKAPAGFDLSFSLTAFDAVSSYGYAFWTGFLNTCLVSALGIVGATLIGGMMGVARWSRLPILADVGTIYVEIFRNVPLLLQIFFWYFSVVRSLPNARDTLNLADTIFLNNRGLYFPGVTIDSSASLFLAVLTGLAIVTLILFHRTRRHRIETGTRPSWDRWKWLSAATTLAFGLVWATMLEWQIPTPTRFGLKGGVEIVPELAALTVGLSIYFGTYTAETVRAGLNSIAKGQREAAFALGLTFRRTLLLVLLPQALRNMVPPMANIYLTLVKASALGAAIAYPELLQIANTTLNQTGQALEVAMVLIAAYLTLNLAIVGGLGLLERRYRIVNSNG